MGGENDFMGENTIRKLLKKENMVLLILGGLLLVVIAMPVGSGEKRTDVTETGSYSVAETETVVDEYSSPLEKQLEDMLSQVTGVGSVEVMITLETTTEKEQILYPQVEGVLVSCEGAGKGTVNAEITEALQALFNLEAHKIKVLSMNGGS